MSDVPDPLEFHNYSPFDLIARTSNNLTIATLQDYDDPIQFLLHRMKSVTPIERKAVTPEGFTLQGYIDSCEFGYPLGGRVKLNSVKLNYVDTQYNFG